MIKFTAEISNKETTFRLDTYTYKGARFEKDAILDVRTHFRGSQWGGGLHDYRLKFWLFYG